MKVGGEMQQLAEDELRFIEVNFLSLVDFLALFE